MMHRIKSKAPGFFLLVLALVLASSRGLFAGEITVSAAISLKDAFSEIAESFEKKYPSTRILLNFASSGQLKKQIEQGARVDVFASASLKQMNSLQSRGLIIVSTMRVFAKNRLTIISNSEIKNIKDLLGDGFKRIAVGNPLTVPAGEYAKEAFIYYGIYDKLKDRFVFAENVRQALDYIRRNDADAAVVYATDYYPGPSDNRLNVIEVDRASTGDISYPIAVVAGAVDEAAARAFVDFAVSGGAVEILKRHGFSVPVEGER